MKKQICSDRYELITRIPQGGIGAEVGVCHGDFSRMLLDGAKPSKLHLIDWWKGNTEKYQKKNDARYGYVCDRFSKEICDGVVSVHRIESRDALRLFDRGYFDWVYLDGSTEPSVVRSDIFGYYDRLKPGGLLILAGVSDEYPDSVRYITFMELMESKREAFIRYVTNQNTSALHTVVMKRAMLVMAGSGGGNKAGGDPFTYEPELWQHMIDRYEIGSVLDVGCGEGHTAKWFASVGVGAIGIDCVPQNVYSGQRGIRSLWDCEDGPFFAGSVDLAWCCEVAEHIEEKYVYNLLWTLSQARVVAMSHAQPGAFGYHHVNLKDDSYWIEKAANVGLKYMEEETKLARETSRNGYFRKSGLIFFSTTEEIRWRLL